MSFPKISQLWRNTKAMPFALQQLCQGAMVAPPILGVLLILPIMEWTINGKQISYLELWQSGAGATTLVFLLMSTVGAWGLAARASWSRWMLAATPSAPVLMAATYPRNWFTQDAAGDLSVWMSAITTSLIIAACLFLIPAVKKYFSDHAGSGV